MNVITVHQGVLDDIPSMCLVRDHLKCLNSDADWSKASLAELGEQPGGSATRYSMNICFLSDHPQPSLRNE